MLRTSEFVVNFVLNSAWQIAVVFVLTALASWLLKDGPARFRHTDRALAVCLVRRLTATRVVLNRSTSCKFASQVQPPEFPIMQPTGDLGLTISEPVAGSLSLQPRRRFGC